MKVNINIMIRKHCYSFLTLLIVLCACVPSTQAQVVTASANDLERAAGEKFVGLEYEVPQLNVAHKEMADQYLDLLAQGKNDKANRQLLALMDTIQAKPFRQRINAWVSVGHYFVGHRAEKAAKMCQEKVDNTDKALTQRYVVLFCAEVAELCRDYALADKYYKEALYINDRDVLALNRKAHVNKFINSETAIQDLNQLLALNSADYNAYKNLGDIQYNYATKAEEGTALQRRDLARAVEYYRLYFAYVPEVADSVEFRACLRYTQSLYTLLMLPQTADSLKQQYAEACQHTAQKALDLGIVPSKAREREMRGYIFYCDMEMADYAQADKHIAYISKREYPDSLYSILDYSYAGKYEAEKGSKQQAIAYYDRILGRDASRAPFYDHITQLYRQMDQPLSAVPYQEKVAKMLGDKKTPANDLLHARLYKDALKLPGADTPVLQAKFDSILNSSINYYAARLALDSVKQSTSLMLCYTEGITELCHEAGRPIDAIPYYKRYLELRGDNKGLSDELQLANLYRSASLKDKQQAETYLLAADEIYERIAEEMVAPENAGRYNPAQYYLPWYHRAALWIKNANEAEEKPKMYYEKALSLISNDAAYKRHKEVCAQYLMFYYFKTHDDETCKKYLTLVLDVNPSNRLALQIKNVLKEQ